MINCGSLSRKQRSTLQNVIFMDHFSLQLSMTSLFLEICFFIFYFVFIHVSKKMCFLFENAQNMYKVEWTWYQLWFHGVQAE